jgi:LPS export ABC transporter protein LptC
MKALNVLLLAAASTAIAACGGNLSEPTGEGYRDLEADKIMIGAHYVPTEDGVRKAVGVFDTVFVYDDSSTYNLRGVNLDIYNTEGKPAAKVTSEGGRLNVATDAMTATGNVVLITPENERIETEELHYDPTTHRIWSDVETHRLLPDGTQQVADSFTSDDQFLNASFVGLRGAVGGLQMKFR